MENFKFLGANADELIRKSTMEDAAMTPQEAIRILMLSPFYFRMNLVDRKQLVVEFCSIHVGILPAKAKR